MMTRLHFWWCGIFAVLKYLVCTSSLTTTPKTTTVYVKGFNIPPLRYNYTQARIVPKIPQAMDPKITAEVRCVTSMDSCGMVALISEPDIDATIRTIQLSQKKTYNATISWFKVTQGCEYPMFLMDMRLCDPKREFGICALRSPSYWLEPLTKYMFLTDDELGLIMMAPAQFNQGQYRRVITIDGSMFYTDFIVQLSPTPCWFAKPDRYEEILHEWCRNVKTIGLDGARDYHYYWVPYNPQPHHKAVLLYWYRTHGREPPVRFQETIRYDRPAIPSGSEDSKRSNDSRGESSGPNWIDIENYTPKNNVPIIISDDDVPTAPPKGMNNQSVVIPAIVLSCLIIALILGVIYYILRVKRSRSTAYQQLPIIHTTHHP
nr:glycoprotein D [Felid alphaherpesvirus 1]